MLSSSDINHHASDYGEIRLSCTVYLMRGIHDAGNEVFLRQVCALLNSGGGMISMQNVDVVQNVLPKHLDLWWSGMESSIARILSADDIVNFVDFIGNFDDAYFYLFVKSAECYCTMDYCCRLPTDTATHEVSYKSAVRLCQRESCFASLERLPAIPTRFEYGRTEETLKQEGKQIQFKLVTSRKEVGGKSLAMKVSHYSSRYISAFANHEGGHIYFGIEDATSAAYGETMGYGDEADIVDTMERRIKSMIWIDTKFVPQRGVHWDIHFLPVFKNAGYLAETTVIVVSVCKVSGGVFTSGPESYIVTRQPVRNEQPSYGFQKPKFDDWKRLLLNQTRDCPPLHTRFVKLPLLTPQCRLTFSLPQTLQTAREKVIKLSTGLNFHPRNILHCLTCPRLKQVLTQFLGIFAEDEHLAFDLDSWGLSYPFPQTKPDAVVFCLAVFSLSSGLHVVTLVDRSERDEGAGGEHDAWVYTSEMAVNLKHCLVNHGGCINRLGIKLHILDTSSPSMLETFQRSVKVNVYPQTYCMRERSMNQILNALTIAIASYKPFGSNRDMDHYFLLTSDQLELLWTHQYTKDLWVHGPPGAGKTVAALEMVKGFRGRGNRKDQILYVAENSLICSYVQSFNICLVVSRRQLMADASNEDLLNTKYGWVKNVIVDEAQNFKSRDGDWYALLERLSKQNIVNGQFDVTAGYFWLFMDYAQKVHKFEAGLPGLIGKNNFMLSEISRNSKEIFEYASKFMDEKDSTTTENSINDSMNTNKDKAMQVKPVLGHQFSTGRDVSVVKCDKSRMHDVLFQVLKKFSEDGVEFDDMAILVSKKKDSQGVKNSIKKTDLFGSISVDAPNSISQRDNESSLSADVDMSLTDSLAVSTSHLPDSSSSAHSVGGSNADDERMASEMPVSLAPLYGNVTSGDSTVSASDPVLVSTIREFSGLDKSVIVGMEPHTNPDHADLEKMILNMATRARDSLVILTTSDELMGVLSPPQ